MIHALTPMEAAPFRPPTALVPPAEALLAGAVAAVLRHAREGSLPLFARTLGMPQRELLALVEHCLPGRRDNMPIPASKYAALAEHAPVVFHELVALLLAGVTPGVDGRQAGWLARAVAAAGMGRRHLWQDLGLAGREEVLALLRHYFLPLYAANTDDIKWKRFLFEQLGRTLGRPGLRPPGCGCCEQAAACFGSGPAAHAAADGAD
ncbi:nitrogen fixation protein NifQ [Rugamonas sp. CCM 8940]|uniref:nitrogen fixation protein NifQ n=1 Tax=Rugamonas sp. CCM 8940 TaxID=2765359 RepID=UPI0018F47B0E|nr:nitrogen fixation protein NifQ [Rugamonas sp. CCM 8940]MBJ7312713.1 nitrogen fixation protein NifQ [Rugamonas sp. CCM 8940]